MRISDWSSDVCSSDLVASLLRGKYPSILPMIEGARGLANAAQIAAHAASVGLLFGGADLAGEMGIVPGWEALGYARSALVLACAQAGRPAFDMPSLDLVNMDVVEADSLRAKGMGLDRKSTRLNS